MTHEDLIEAVARSIASAMGDNYADAFKDKSRWIAKRGMSGGRYRDVNEPMRCDYDEAARAAISVIAPAVLDEAAKEADEYAAFHDKHDDGLSGFDYMASGAREVAENIRALKTRYEG